MEHQSINWIQISTKNLHRAAKFYKKVFDADFFFEELNEIPHAVFIENEKGIKLLNGALIQIEEDIDIKSGTSIFFDATGEFDAIIHQIKKHGGKILTPKTLIRRKIKSNMYTIPNTYIDNKIGYYAHFLDSEGNKLGLYGNS